LPAEAVLRPLRLLNGPGDTLAFLGSVGGHRLYLMAVYLMGVLSSAVYAVDRRHRRHSDRPVSVMEAGSEEPDQSSEARRCWL